MRELSGKFAICPGAPGRVAIAALLFSLLSPLAGFANEQSIDAQATTLFKSLNEDQRAKALLPFEDKERNSEVFTGGERPGIQIKSLNEDQQKQAVALITAFTSDYGKAKAEAVAQQGPQPGFGRYYLCFFGDPTKDKSHAWRIAEHHLTLVHVEVEEGTPTVFGPILLGANPPTLWDEEEDVLIALYAALSKEDVEKVSRRGKGISSELFKDGEGAAVSELSDSARAKLNDVYENRLKFFSTDIQKRIRELVEKQGGLGAMRVAFWGVADKRCRDGGRWDFKLGGEAFLCDYEGSRAHIHLAMKGWLNGSR